MLGAYYAPSALAPINDMNWDEKPAVRTHPSTYAPAITSISQYLPTNGLGQMSMLTEYRDGSLGSLLTEYRDGSLGYPGVRPTPMRFGTPVDGYYGQEVAGLGRYFGPEVAGMGRTYNPATRSWSGLGRTYNPATRAWSGMGCPCMGTNGADGLGTLMDTWNGMSTTQKVLAGAGVGLVAIVGIGMMTGGKKRRR